MAINFTQTATAATHGVIAACSGNSVSTKTPNSAKQATEGGTADSSTKITVTMAGSESTGVNVGFETAASEPGITSWASGTWTVRLNINQSNSNITWEEVHICRVNSAGTSQETIGSATGMGISLGTTGVKSQAVTGSSATASATDRVYVALSFSNSHGGNQTFKYYADQNIDSPLVVSASNVSEIPAGSLSLTGNIPTAVATEKHISNIPADSLAVTGNVPTVTATDNNYSDIPAGSLTTTGNVPSAVTTEKHISDIAAGSLGLTSNVPSAVTTEKNISDIAAGSLALTGNVPQAVTSESASNEAEIPVGSLTLTGNVPSATTTEKHISNIPLATLALTGNVPTATNTDIQVSEIPTGSLSLTGNVPSATNTENQSASIPAGGLTFSGLVPSAVTTEANIINLTLGTLTLAGIAPQVVATSLAVPGPRISIAAQHRQYRVLVGEKVYDKISAEKRDYSARTGQRIFYMATKNRKYIINRE